MIMRDSIDPTLIPPSTPIVAGYGDGRYEWTSAGWALFPNAIPLVIVVSAVDAGDVLDVERFDATPADVPGWIDRFQRPRRRRPTIYSARGTDALGRVDYSVIRAILQAAAGRPFDWWAATLDGTADFTEAPIQPVAVQVRDVGAYDESIILDPSWVPKEDASMGLWIRNQDRLTVAVIDADGVRLNPPETSAREQYAAAAGVPPWVNLSDADFSAAIAGLTVLPPATPPDLSTIAAQVAATAAAVARIEAALQKA